MTSLKELEEDLKRLIEERNGLQPNFNTTNSINTSNFYIKTNMAVEEHGQPFNKRTDMVIREHGQPFNKQFSYSRMAVREHGQPYRNKIEESAQNLLNECQTLMVVREHGQPYKQVWYDIEGNPFNSYESKQKSDEMISDKKYDHIRRNGMCVTKMAVREHGQPFKAVWYDTEGNPHIVQTKMASREHGRPYRNTSSEKTLAERVQDKINAVMGWK